MNNTFSISFSDKAFELIHISDDKGELSFKTGYQFPYTNTNGIDQIFCSENIDIISQSITKIKKENSIDTLSLVFTLPFNYAVIKKVAFPHDSSKEQKKNQISWELSANLAEPLNTYKVMIVSETKTNKAYTEAIVTAISKETIKKLSTIAEQNDSEISRVFLNCFALENFLSEENQFDDNQNYYFLKSGEKFLEHHFFSGKQYFLSYIEPIDSSRKFDEYIAERSNEKHKQVENLISQVNNNSYILYVYGNGLQSTTIESLKSRLSIKVELAEVNNLPDNDSFKYVEAWGAVL